jgi:hypothetical protein
VFAETVPAVDDDSGDAAVAEAVGVAVEPVPAPVVWLAQAEIAIATASKGANARAALAFGRRRHPAVIAWYVMSGSDGLVISSSRPTARPPSSAARLSTWLRDQPPRVVTTGRNRRHCVRGTA